MIGPDFLFTFKPGVYGRIRCGKISGEIGTLEKGQAEGKIALKENFETYLIPTEENEIRSKISHLLLSQFDTNLEKLKDLDPTVFEKTEKLMKDKYVGFDSIFTSKLEKCKIIIHANSCYKY